MRIRDDDIRPLWMCGARMRIWVSICCFMAVVLSAFRFGVLCVNTKSLTSTILPPPTATETFDVLQKLNSAIEKRAAYQKDIFHTVAEVSCCSLLFSYLFIYLLFLNGVNYIHENTRLNVAIDSCMHSLNLQIFFTNEKMFSQLKKRL